MGERSIWQVLLFQNVERRESRCAGKRVGSEGSRVQRFAGGDPSAEGLAVCEHCCDRQATAERLAAAEKIRTDSLGLDRKAVPCAAKAGEDLVGDEQGSGAPAKFCKGGKPTGRGEQDTLPANDRFEDDSTDVAAAQALGERTERSTEREALDV